MKLGTTLGIKSAKINHHKPKRGNDEEVIINDECNAIILTINMHTRNMKHVEEITKIPVNRINAIKNLLSVFSFSLLPPLLLLLFVLVLVLLFLLSVSLDREELKFTIGIDNENDNDDKVDDNDDVEDDGEGDGDGDGDDNCEPSLVPLSCKNFLNRK